MKKNTEKDVFERYRQYREERILLKSMLAHLDELSEDEIIIAMNYDVPDEIRGKRSIGSGHIPYIAMNYKKEFAKRYEEEARQCMERFMIVDKELAIIDAGIHLLPEDQQKFVKYYLEDNLTWFEIEELLSISHATLGRWRQKVSEKLENYIELMK